jgi:hypothetical protein
MLESLPMPRFEAADQALTVLTDQRHHQIDCVAGLFALSQNHLGQPSASNPADVEPRLPIQLVKLCSAELSVGIILSQLTSQEAPKDVPHHAIASRLFRRPRPSTFICRRTYHVEGMNIMDVIRDRSRFYVCPACGRNLSDCEMRMLEANGNRFTVQMKCVGCRAGLIVLVASRAEPDTESKLEGVRELPRAEPAVTGPQPIGIDDVLDAHLALRDHNGSLTDLLRSNAAE